jgi:gliding motility associated protien GldN
MKKLVFFGLVFFIGATTMVQAQSKYKKPGGKPATTAPATVAPAPAANTTNTAVKPRTKSAYITNNVSGAISPDTTRPGAGSGTVTSALPSSAAVTVRYDTTIPGGFDTKQEVSLRSNYAVERQLVKDRKPLEYDYIREDDQVWSQFVWEEIDGREKMNQGFVYPGKDDNGDQRFFSILLNAIKYDSVVAFSPDNDLFRTPLTSDQVANLTAGTLDSVDVPDPVSGAIEKVITRKPRFSPDSVYTFRIKEQWIFDKEASKMTCRIIGIAPIAKQVVANKSQPRTLFWIYYPDLRKTLVKYEVYNPKNYAGRMSWEELFESRYFTSYVIKSTINNPGDKYLNGLIKDPLLRLLEGQNIKEKIFNYEQDLWAY